MEVGIGERAGHNVCQMGMLSLRKPESSGAGR